MIERTGSSRYAREVLMMRGPASCLAVLLVCLWPAVAECTLDVVTSIYPVSSIVSEIGGDRVRVMTLVPAGSDPHHFELTPKKAKALYRADLVFLIGGHFDRWILPGESQDLEPPTVIEFYRDFGDSLLPLGNTFNPHFWLDPLFAGAMGKAACVALAAADSVNRSYYEARARVFVARIDSLHASTKSRLARSGLRGFVSFHPAWSYFARRYGLTEYATIEVSHEQEPSAKHIAEVVKQMQSSGIEFILAEEFSNLDLARQVASETGAAVIVLDPLGGPGMPDRDSYFKLIGYNTATIEREILKKGN
jgi:zinc transport system substrate-binding protein